MRLRSIVWQYKFVYEIQMTKDDGEAMGAIAHTGKTTRGLSSHCEKYICFSHSSKFSC